MWLILMMTLWAEISKLSEFLSANFQFLEVKFSIYLNRRDFVMFLHKKKTKKVQINSSGKKPWIYSFVIPENYKKTTIYFSYSAENIFS